MSHYRTGAVLPLFMDEPTTPVGPPRTPLEPSRLDWTPSGSELQHEAQDRENACAAILARLETGVPATTWEMIQLGGSGFSSRINELRVELRKRGGDIPPPEKHGRVWYYRLELPR